MIHMTIAILPIRWIISLSHLFVLSGQIKNLIAKGQFPFQDILNKRILFLDELKIPAEFADDFKDIFAAQDVLINKKYKQATTSCWPTSCIICSNMQAVVDIKDPIWSSRITQYTTKPYAHTLDPNRNELQKIYPLAWIDVFNEELDLNM